MNQTVKSLKPGEINYFNKNIEALKKVNPERAKWIEEEPDQDWIELIHGSNGTPNLRLKLGARQILAYEMDDPWKLPRKKAADVNRYKENTSIIVGMGLGYIPRAIMEIMEEGHRIVVIESQAHIMRLAFSLSDFSKEIASQSLTIGGPGTQEVGATVAQLDQDLLKGDLYMTYEDYAQKFSRDYKPLGEHTWRVLNQLRANMGTISTKGAEISLNEIKALPYVLRARGAGQLKDIFKDLPVIIVSTGPSLGKNIHLLRKIQGKAVIIATGQALRPLLAYGIKPNFIATIDFADANMGHYAGLMATEDVPMIALCRTYAPLIRDYQGQIFVVGSAHKEPDYYLHRLWKYKGILIPGNSVTHLCYSTARCMGASPIIFVGQDLAVSETTHFDQVDRYAKVKKTGDGGMVNTPNDHRHDAYGEKRKQGKQLFVPGYYGGRVLTQPALLSFHTLLERIIELDKGVKIINATEGGAKIKGTEQMSLNEAIETFCTEPIDFSKLEGLSGPDPMGNNFVDQIVPLLKEEAALLNDVIKHSRKGLATNTGLTKLLERPGTDRSNPRGPFQYLLHHNFRASNATQESASKLAPVRMAIFGAQAEIMRRDLNVEFHLDDLESVQTRVKRNRKILEAAYDASKKLKEVYTEAIALLERYVQVRKKEDGPPVEMLALGRVLEEIGEASASAEIYDRLIELEPENIEAWEAKGWLALKREQFLEAAEAVEKLNTLSAGKAVALQEEIDSFLFKVLDKSEDDLEQGNFARPILNAAKYLKARPDDHRAQNILAQAETMRDERVLQAEEDAKIFAEEMAGDKGKLIRYRDLVVRSKDLGFKDKNYQAALELLQEAAELIPDIIDARWGLATTLRHLGRTDESLEVYQKLVADFADVPRFRFEMGMVLMQVGQIHEGLDLIKDAMAESEEFNFFLPKMGDVYRLLHQPAKALPVYERHLEKTPADYETWTREGDCLCELGQFKRAAESYQRAASIKPEFVPAQDGLRRVGHLCEPQAQSAMN